MAENLRTDDRADAAEPKFYLPAGTSPSSGAGLFERLWAALFDHGVEPPR